MPCRFASSRDTAAPKRSGSTRGRVGGPFGLSEEPRWDETRSASLTELARDRELRLEPEKNAEKTLDERGLSVLALEDRREALSGCFLVRRREFLS